MRILDLGNWTRHPELCGRNLCAAAEQAHRLAYDAARLTLAGTSRPVVILILARPPGEPGLAEHYLLAPELPERPALLGLHPEDSDRL